MVSGDVMLLRDYAHNHIHHHDNKHHHCSLYAHWPFHLQCRTGHLPHHHMIHQYLEYTNHVLVSYSKFNVLIVLKTQTKLPIKGEGGLCICLPFKEGGLSEGGWLIRGGAYQREGLIRGEAYQRGMAY